MARLQVYTQPMTVEAPHPPPSPSHSQCTPGQDHPGHRHRLRHNLRRGGGGPPAFVPPTAVQPHGGQHGQRRGNHEAGQRSGGRHWAMGRPRASGGRRGPGKPRRRGEVAILHNCCANNNSRRQFLGRWNTPRMGQLGGDWSGAILSPSGFQCPEVRTPKKILLWNCLLFDETPTTTLHKAATPTSHLIIIP